MPGLRVPGGQPRSGESIGLAETPAPTGADPT